jgi:hypothetical protein
MGGRGSSSPGNVAFLTPAELEALPYHVTGYDDSRGGAVFPFLEQTGRAWRILTRPVADRTEPHPAHTFGLAAPTLRWVNGEQVSDLYVDGMTTQQFLAATGLELELRKGGFVLSKRLSRLMRPHFVSGFFEPDEVAAAYLEQSPEEAKVWDGAGLVSRRMLRKMTLPEGLDPARRERLEAELRHVRRVEFTIMTSKGQDKGHAVVADDLRDDDGRPVDFLLPRDTKREIRLESGRTFVGLSAVHGHNNMRLDIQSLINLHPFFQEEQLLGWLREEGELFVESVEGGSVAEVMGRIDRHTELEDVQRWPLREYLASGGHPMWFRSHVRSLMNQHLRRLNHSTLEKLRLPIPGGRHYVMPAGVGKRAGIQGLDVPRGHIQIDAGRGTAWVNDEDWLALPDSPKDEGIAGILGGADNDDALWLYPFTDHDGERKVLAWRSPNQAGEYVILKPTASSNPLPWTRAGGETLTAVPRYPQADSRRLPPRIDFTDPAYLGLVDASSAGSLGEGEAYSVAAMEAAIDRAVANRGALGMYCNSLMLNKSLYGRLPEHPPAPLEDIIDSTVKTGADLSRVVAWNYANSREILERRERIPILLHPRLSIDYRDEENRPPPPRMSTDHWLDKLEAGIRIHIQEMIHKRDELAQRAVPPPALFASVAGDPAALALGAGLNQAYAGALSIGRKRGEGNVLERARLAVEDYLAHFPPPRRQAILRGALVSAYSGAAGKSDAAAWLSGEESGTSAGRPSVAGQTMAALRSIGLLGEISESADGLVVYPNAETAHVEPVDEM